MLTMFVLAAAAAATPKPLAPSIKMKTAIAQKLDLQLLDGESARYRWPMDRHGVVYCGLVNAKNSYGAYTGFKGFYVLGMHHNGPKGDGGYTPVTVKLIDPEDVMGANYLSQCNDAGYDLSGAGSE